MKSGKVRIVMCSKGIYIVVFWFFSLIAGANPPEEMAVRQLKIAIKPVFNSEAISLGDKNYVSAEGDTLQIDRFRFYLSAVEIVFSDGSVYAEKNSYHLIDAEFDSTLIFDLKDVPTGKINSIRFNIGVDSVKSVSGAFSGDLDPIHGMYWAWNSGYIHAKLEGRSKSCKTHQNIFEYHVGGFANPENALRNVALKMNPDFSEGDQITMTSDAATWLKNISLSKTPSVVIPGKKAMAIADDYVNMFRIIPEK